MFPKNYLPSLDKQKSHPRILRSDLVMKRKVDFLARAIIEYNKIRHEVLMIYLKDFEDRISVSCNSMSRRLSSFLLKYVFHM